jgi:hypothetical protein
LSKREPQDSLGFFWYCLLAEKLKTFGTGRAKDPRRKNDTILKQLPQEDATPFNDKHDNQHVGKSHVRM